MDFNQKKDITNQVPELLKKDYKIPNPKEEYKYVIDGEGFIQKIPIYKYENKDDPKYQEFKKYFNEELKDEYKAINEG